MAVFIGLPAVAAAQEMMPASASAWTALTPRAVIAPALSTSQGSTGYALSVHGNGVSNEYGGWTTRVSGLQGGAFYRFSARAVPVSVASVRESVSIVVRWRGSYGDEVSPDEVWDYRAQADGSLRFDRILQAPPGTSAVDVELILQWAPNGHVTFDALSFTPATMPAARPVNVAAVYFRPSGSSSGIESVRQAAGYADQVASTRRLDVMVLGEMLNVIGAPGSYDEKAETVPGPSTDIIASVARGHGVYIAFGILERQDNFLYNTAVLVDRSGAIVARHRKVQLPLTEAAGGLTPGDSVSVVDTDFGRVSMLICQDTAFAEPAREAALQGAEMLLVPIWGGKTSLVRSRAVEHGIYLAAAGYDYLSEVVGPLGNVLATAPSADGPGAAIATVDLSQRFREQWLGDWRDIWRKELRTEYARFNPDTPAPPSQADTTPPAVTISSPSSGATVSGSLAIAATASDNVGVARVTFLIDGAPLGDDSSAPFSATWDSTSAANGTHVLSAAAYDAAGNTTSASVTVTVANTAPPPPPPTAFAVPGTIQAEDYDAGADGSTYHDTTVGNTGGAYRNDGVDIQATTDAGGGYNVGWMDATEWLSYTINVDTAGSYTLTARVAANGAGGTFHVEIGGTDVTGPLAVPDTGGWQQWTDVTKTVTLPAGTQRMRVVVDALGSAGIFGNLNYVRFSAAATSSPQNIVLYVTDLTRHGAWTLASDASAAAGQKTMTADNGVANTSAPLASPGDYFEATFTPRAGVPYALWIRLKATGNSKFNESVWVQFSGAQANGGALYPIGSSSALAVNLEPCKDCGVSGWGWQNGAYWLNQQSVVTFANANAQTIRVQVREDGAQIDQIVLSPAQYLSTAPGPVKDDTTIVPKSFDP